MVKLSDDISDNVICADKGINNKNLEKQYAKLS